jgi:predicted outer membrane repeat protein
MTIQQSTFQLFAHTGIGAAIYSISSDTFISNSVFQSNKALDGAAIYFDCADVTLCTYNITNTRFQNNTATRKGGAIAFDIFPPNIVNPTFVNNTAIYGPNVAGYPYKILNLTDPTTYTYVSGQPILNEMRFALVDSFGEKITTDSESVFTISATTSGGQGAKVIGNTDVTVTQGIGFFKDVTFIVAPGTKGV